MSVSDFEVWLSQPDLEAEFNVFVITDDDESNEWGQGETLEGVEGEVAGYTVIQLYQEHDAYHLLCKGAVHPEYRRLGAGEALLICALNRARMWTAEIEFGTQDQQYPIYFEVLLPVRDAASENLATKCEMELTDEPTLKGMRLYRRAL